jgi:hypothetical protein
LASTREIFEVFSIVLLPEPDYEANKNTRETNPRDVELQRKFRKKNTSQKGNPFDKCESNVLIRS